MIRKPVSLCGCRSSLPQCSQVAAVRFTSWLLDRTHCSTGNNWTCCSGINRWRLPSLFWICLVMPFFFLLLCWLMLISTDTGRHIDSFVLNPFLCLFWCPCKCAWIHSGVDQNSRAVTAKMLESISPSMSTESSLRQLDLKPQPVNHHYQYGRN